MAIGLVCSKYVGVVSIKGAWPKFSYSIIYFSAPPSTVGGPASTPILNLNLDDNVLCVSM